MAYASGVRVLARPRPSGLLGARVASRCRLRPGRDLRVDPSPTTSTYRAKPMAILSIVEDGGAIDYDFGTEPHHWIFR